MSYELMKKNLLLALTEIPFESRCLLFQILYFRALSSLAYAVLTTISLVVSPRYSHWIEDDWLGAQGPTSIVGTYLRQASSIRV